MRAVYPGSFDPLTIGHLDIIKRGSWLFDLTIGVGINQDKTPFIPVDERVDLIYKVLEAEGYPANSVDVWTYSDLLVDFARRQDAQVILRGVRPTGDFDSEFQMAMINRDLAPELETLFIPTTLGVSYVSSSMVRQVLSRGGDYSKLVPAPVAEYLREREKKTDINSEVPYSLISARLSPELLQRYAKDFTVHAEPAGEQVRLRVCYSTGKENWLYISKKEAAEIAASGRAVEVVTLCDQNNNVFYVLDQKNTLALAGELDQVLQNS